MRNVRTWVLWFLLVMLYPVAGCTVLVVDAREPGDAGCETGSASHDAEASWMDPDSGRLDATETVRSDAGNTDVRSGATHDAAMLPEVMEGPDFVVLAPTTCSDRRLHLPAVHLAPDRDLWHLCFVGPANRERQLLPVHDRPVEYAFTRWMGTREPPTDLGRAMAPRTADPWTASVLISVPKTPAAYPFFNVRMVTAAGDLWATVPDPMTGVESAHGALRLWRVASDGTQMALTTRLLPATCDLSVEPGFGPRTTFVPELTPCPPDLWGCLPLRDACRGQ
jgi:hypothetical protein